MMNSFSHRPARVDAKRAAHWREDITSFHAEYCSVLDRGDLEQWPLFFTEDALYRVTGRENSDLGLPVGLVYCEGRAMMHDRAVAIARTQMFAPRYSLHIIGQVRVEAEDGDSVTAQTPFLLVQTLVEGPSTVHLAACYHDCFVRSGEGLLLVERHVIHDTNILANDLVYPA